MPPTPLPSPINGSAILKNTNVSFNSYSKEWPVGWEWIDPDPHPPAAHDTGGKVLHVIVPKGRDMSGDNRTAPRYVKAIAGDFEIETKVVAKPVFNYQGAGLLIWRAEKDYIRFERAYGPDGGGIRVLKRSGDEETEIAATTTFATDSDETVLRIRRVGNNFTFLWRDKNSDWQKAGSCVADYPLSVFAGLFAVNTAVDFDVRFGYVRLEPPGER